MLRIGPNIWLRRDRLLVRIPPPPSRARPADALGDRAQVVEEAGPALPPRERAVERGHGLGMARIVVADEGAQHAGEQHGESLGADHAAGPGGGNIAAVGIGAAIAAGPLSANAARVAHDVLSPLSTVSLALQLAGRPRHSEHQDRLILRGTSALEHGSVDLLHLRGKDRKRRAVARAQFGERDAGTLGDLGKADLLDRLVPSSP